MAVLGAEERRRMPESEFAGPNRSFPINDATHQREAISGATRSEHAGNISASEAERIKAEARAKLHHGGAEEHRAAVHKMHPAHVHQLVQEAAAGKHGPDAQQLAHRAMQAPPEGPQQMQPQQPGRNYASMFDGQGEPDGDEGMGPSAPIDRGSMF